MKCQYCGNEIPDNSVFCPFCGQKPVLTKTNSNGETCNNCGAPLEPGSTYCPNCGKAVTGKSLQSPAFEQSSQSYVSPHNSSPTRQQPPQKRKTGLIVAIVIICLVVLAGIGTTVGFFVFGNKSEKKVEDVAISQDEIAENKSEENVTDEDDSSKDAADDADSNAGDDADSDGVDTGVTADGKFKSLEGFVNSDIMKEQLESQMESLEGTGISCDLAADGDKLIYNFTIEDETLASAMDKATLDSQLESMASTFESIASTLPAAVEGVENPAVVVRYLDPAGEEITSMEFTAD